jgi:hypothetical protein
MLPTVRVWEFLWRFFGPFDIPSLRWSNTCSWQCEILRLPPLKIDTDKHKEHGSAQAQSLRWKAAIHPAIHPAFSVYLLLLFLLLHCSTLMFSLFYAGRFRWTANTWQAETTHSLLSRVMSPGTWPVWPRNQGWRCPAKSKWIFHPRLVAWESGIVDTLGK